MKTHKAAQTFKRAVVALSCLSLCSLRLCGSLASPPGPRLAVIQQAPAFELTTQDGKPLRLADLKGKVLLVSFIFTTCSGSCPATTHRMGQVQQALQERSLFKDDQIHFVSISLDPARDTPEVLRQYMKLYDADPAHWSFLTGTPEATAKVLAAWGMWARPAANGQLDHPSRVYLVDQQGRIREMYNLEFLKLAWVVEDIELLLNETMSPTRQRG
jgi:protein SCO1/2